ncbi:hypothetical protein [Clostridium saccharoperbutylacetonicum]|uniref:hypothetical protein n=1 Tax=Clostridium saccharoperbutylacetonicum TaxID=36745 RepID=UPI0039EAABA5
MKNEIKTESNNFASFTSVSTNATNLQSNVTGGRTSSDKKDAGNNEWSSVPLTYDKEDSTEKKEKTATNNQWCSTSK